MQNQFYVTRDLFKEYIGYCNPLSYDEWNSLPEDHKAAVLYLQFFDQITLAWYKCCRNFSRTEDGVSEVLQYLNKNVSIIEKDSKRFKPAYIYRVAYNCLYCISEDCSRNNKIYQNECSNVTQCGEDELDLFDTVVGSGDLFDEYFYEDNSKKFWDTIEDMGQDTMAVVSQLLGEKNRKASRMKEDKRNQIIDDLKIQLEEYDAIFRE